MGMGMDPLRVPDYRSEVLPSTILGCLPSAREKSLPSELERDIFVTRARRVIVGYWTCAPQTRQNCAAGSLMAWTLAQKRVAGAGCTGCYNCWLRLGLPATEQQHDDKQDNAASIPGLHVAQLRLEQPIEDCQDQQCAGNDKENLRAVTVYHHAASRD
jgi:hypothetical protein